MAPTGTERDGKAPQDRLVIARIVTDVSGMDKEFDYVVPLPLVSDVEVGSQVRVDLAGRRVGGWILSLHPGESQPARNDSVGWQPSQGDSVGSQPPKGQQHHALKPIAALRGRGPTSDVVELADWASWRWAARRAPFLVAASSRKAVRQLPEPRLAAPAAPPTNVLPAASGAHIFRIGPAGDPTALIAEAAQRGPTLVIVPTGARAAVLAGRLRRAGGDVALLPEGWPQARAGVAVVVGSRGAAWAPCPGLAAVVVIDAHDELHSSERAPTWSALTVAAERARRAGAPCYLVSSCPTAELLALGPMTTVDPDKQRAGWARVEVVDQRGEDPRVGLYGNRLVDLIRSSAKVACILNRTGRVRLLVCATCATIARCEVCHGAVSSPEPGLLSCQRCGAGRPYVCTSCTSIRLSSLRIGTKRAREDLERLAGREVSEVIASTGELPGSAVLVGTEALLRRLEPSSGFSTVVFLDFDQELLAPRVSAGEHSLALLSTASRLVKGKAGLVVIQTRIPDHPVVRAAVLGDPKVALEPEEALRRELRLPPYAALALVSGDASSEWINSLKSIEGSRVEGSRVEVFGPDGAKWLVKASDHRRLCDALRAVPRLAGDLRVAVDPQRF